MQSWLILFTLFVSEEVSSDLPPSREQRVEQKRFYFDVGSNARGVYLRISEVSTWLYIGQSTDCKWSLFLQHGSKNETWLQGHFLKCAQRNTLLAKKIT